VEVSEVRNEPTIPVVENAKKTETGEAVRQEEVQEESLTDDDEDDEGSAGDAADGAGCVSAMELCCMSMREEAEGESEEEEYSDCDPNQFCEISMDSKLEAST
jgi:hypothetical protein